MARTPVSPRLAERISHKLANAGLSLEAQQKIGTFSTVFAMFENRLEYAIWALEGKDVKGIRPSTDAKQISVWIDLLGNGSHLLSTEANAVIHEAVQAARDLADYRNSLLHGFPVLLGTSAYFIRNHRWMGELRKRDSGTAYTEGHILDLAIETAWALFQLVLSIPPACRDDDSQIVVKHKSDIRLAKSAANEIRHLAELMRHEKF